MLASAPARLLIQRGTGGLGGIQCRGDVGHQQADPARLAVGRLVREHQPAVGLHHRVRRRCVRAGAIRPVAADGHVHKARAALGQTVVAHAHAFGDAGAKILDQDVGLLCHLRQQGFAPRLAGIHAYAALAHVVGDRQRAFAVAHDADMAAPIAIRRLYLHDISALLPEDLGAVGAGDSLAEVQYAQARVRG
ncbi:hypothetical protein D3C72_1329970 [compost metagenome]